MAGATSKPHSQRSLAPLQSLPTFKVNIKFKVCNSHKIAGKNTLEKEGSFGF